MDNLHKVSFDGYLFSDICAVISNEEEFSASYIEEILTSCFDNGDVQYLMMYIQDIITYYGDEDEIRQRLIDLKLEDNTLIFVMV